MMPTTPSVTDSIETLLLMLMDGHHDCIRSDDGCSLHLSKRGLDNKIQKLVYYDISERVRCDDMVPTSVFTVDLTGDRLLAITPDGLMAHPVDMIGDEIEVALFCGDVIKWIGLRKCKSPPRRVAALGRVAAWYEKHYRVIKQDGSGTYQKRWIPLSMTGHAIVAKTDGIMMCNPAEATLAICSACSIAEDAARSDAMLASITDAVEIKLPVPIDDYKAIFSGRDGPIVGGRRKAILHWVAQHMRTSARGKDFSVKKHTRGIQTFTIDGLRVCLTPNEEKT